jgi:hypothetical protein
MKAPPPHPLCDLPGRHAVAQLGCKRAAGIEDDLDRNALHGGAMLSTWPFRVPPAD